MTCPLLPSHNTASRRSTFGWLVSTSVSALLVSAIGAWALAIQESGDAVGDASEAILVMLPPVPAVEAMAEPSPDVVDQAPSEKVEAPDTEDMPETPELTEAPDVPDETPVIEEMLAEDIPEPEIEPPPAPVVEIPKPKPKPVEKEKPKKTAEKPKEKTKEKPKKKASEEAAAAKASKQASNAQASAGSGKASAKSYAASVMKKVRGTKKQRAGEKGVAVVSFTIAEGGGLAGVRIARSSGSAKVDQVALDHIRRAAPFPPPPPGVGRSYSFEFVAK
ncbi:energy transducer TonB family protein [Pseudogemmobacter humi]|uniref:Gram-negative bacterial tonB protein n=1 Tax=Pseudogemmobacter humi TaxID=2483812 RepID=A0A3P5XVH5_9RHOB|nr:TonB family protein [Pseudogemmobacter humi]VDC33096.1 Gram-negative bacterial tonB protein [Pseudogemmobacter humi]